MRSRTRLRALAVVSFIACAAPARIAFADDGSSANVLAARSHFEKARAYYGQGAYREALAELEAAHALDPAAKDLVFNLGVVHEKLADIDDALRWFRLFTTMDLTPQERDRADAYVRRLEGAKKELEQKQASQPSPPQQPPGAAPSPSLPVSPAPAVPRDRPNGRLDGWTVGAMGATVLGLAFGGVMAFKAEQDRPSPSFVTGSSGTYTDLVNRQSDAHREAVLADVGFGVAAVGAISAAYLYFARPRADTTQPTGTTTFGATPLTGGAALSVGGSF